MEAKILLIDDEEKLRTLLAKIISLEGFEVFQAGDLKSGWKKLEQHDIDVVICDVKLPDGDGVEMAKRIKTSFPALETILLTAYGNIPDGVQAMRNGAFDYITKGDDNNRIIPLLYQAAEKVALAKRVQQLEKQLKNKYSFDGVIGKSPLIKAAIKAAQQVAATETTVLLTGETGTGKEVFAHAIHDQSPRKSKPFIAVNCAAFSKELLENELFGHKAGAFTGALKDAKGVLEEANGGTVFLDEIGEMALELQPKLLRVLESGEFLKVGDNKVTKVNIRIVAATNRELLKEIENGRFREDLYYRISVFSIALPSLRERISDIEELALFFLKSFSLKANNKITGISPEYLEALKKHPWKGNIRELKNVIERSVILTEVEALLPEALPGDFNALSSGTSSANPPPSLELSTAEKIHIQKVLQLTNGNKTEAAKKLNIALTTLYRKLEEYKIG